MLQQLLQTRGLQKSRNAGLMSPQSRKSRSRQLNLMKFLASQFRISQRPVGRGDTFGEMSGTVDGFFEPLGVKLLKPHVAQIIGEGTRGRNDIENPSRPGAHVYVNSATGSVVYHESVPNAAPLDPGAPKSVKPYSGFSTVQLKPGGFRTLTSSVIYPTVASEFLAAKAIEPISRDNIGEKRIRRLSLDTAPDSSCSLDYHVDTADILHVSISGPTTRIDSFYVSYVDFPAAAMRLPQVSLKVVYKKDPSSIISVQFR